MGNRQIRKALAASKTPVRRESLPLAEDEGGTWDCRCGMTGIPFWQHPVTCPACGNDVRGQAAEGRAMVNLTCGDGKIEVRRGSKGEELLRKAGWQEERRDG